MQAQDLPAPTREAAADLLNGIRRATYSVNQLLTMTRADASMEGEQDTIEAAVLIRLTVSAAASIAATKRVEMVTEVEDGVQLTVRSSDVQLVLSNLVDNAVRYTGENGRVHIHGRRTTDTFVVEVSDTGCGIPEAALPHIYDRFFRAAPADVDGTGLGLAIAKTAADRNGIRIHVRNRQNAPGVVATVEIPCPPSPAAQSLSPLQQLTPSAPPQAHQERRKPERA